MNRQDTIPLLGVVMFLSAFPVVVSQVEAISHYLDVMIFVGIFSLITMGLSLLMGYAGQVSLGHAAFFGLGADTSGVLCVKLAVSPWVGVMGGALFTGAVAYAVGVASLKLKGHYLAM